jgi:hypothetical protein
VANLCLSSLQCRPSFLSRPFLYAVLCMMMASSIN